MSISGLALVLSTMRPPGEEPQDLARFRQEWLAEVQHRKTPSTGKATTSNTSSGPAAHTTIDAVRSVVSTTSPNVPLPPTLGSAINVYRQAVENEQRGNLDEALILYRQAFRMVTPAIRRRCDFQGLILYTGCTGGSSLSQGGNLDRGSCTTTRSSEQEYGH